MQGVEERQLRRMSNEPQDCREAQGRTRGVIEGNAVDDALMVDQG
ncbi:hypothetical protein ACFL0H_13505 [Thermodesulfobacteriota bacterium]